MEGHDKETIPVQCPFCSAEHEYPLKVSRSRSIGLITSDSYRTEKPRQIFRRRYFICPVQNQKFQATLSLWEWPREPINAVEVGEPIKK
jgi:hypothetical protein